jgi:hypothetical protein
LLSNSKPNADKLITGVAEQLWGQTVIPLFAKPVAAVRADDQLLDEIAAGFDAALVALGD